MRAIVSVDDLGIDKVLYDFVTDEAMPGTEVQARSFWSGFAALVRRLAPRNAELLLRRDELQSKIDAGTVNIRARPSIIRATRLICSRLAI